MSPKCCQNGNTKNTFNSKTTALEVVKDVDLRGKTILVTGSTSGIGIETARAFALKGAHLVLCNRNLEMSKRQRDNLYIESGRSEGIDIIQMDLSSLQSVRAAAYEFLSKNCALDVLILNAGLLGPNVKKTVDGHETTFGVNHLGNFYFTQLLLPKLRQSAPSRLVIVSSELHKYTGISARSPIAQKLEKLILPVDASSFKQYNCSKLCNLLMGMKIHREEKANGINCYVLHPGVVNTDVFRDSGKFMKCIMGAFVAPFAKNIEQGAATTVYCAASPDCANESGHYYEDCKLADGSMTKELALDATFQDALWNKSNELIKNFEKLASKSNGF